MKTLLIITLMLSVLWSCDNPKTKVSIGEEKDSITIIDTIESQIVQNEIDKLDLQYIRECAEQGIKSFNMDSITDTKKYLDNSVTENILGKIPVNEKKDWFLRVNEYERLSCYQWEENENLFLFTLLQQDETCCQTMYLCVTDKNGQLLAIRFLGLSGGDGGWYENDWGEKIEFGKFKLVYDSFNDTDKFENGKDLGYITEHEYTELIISLRGKSFVVDTLKHIKTDTLIAKK